MAIKWVKYGALLISKLAFDGIHKKAIVKSVIATDKSVIIEYTSKDGESRGSMELYDRRHLDTKAIPLEEPHK